MFTEKHLMKINIKNESWNLCVLRLQTTGLSMLYLSRTPDLIRRVLFSRNSYFSPGLRIYKILHKHEVVLSRGFIQLVQSSDGGMLTWWKAFVRNSCHLSRPNRGWLGLSWVSDSLFKTSRAMILKPAVLLLDHSALLDCSENVRRENLSRSLRLTLPFLECSAAHTWHYTPRTPPPLAHPHGPGFHSLSPCLRAHDLEGTEKPGC